MEYLGNCPKCNHHTIVKTIKQIVHTATRKPQRNAKCVNCGKLSRITIIGEFIQEKRKVEVPLTEDKQPIFVTIDKDITQLKFW